MNRQEAELVLQKSFGLQHFYDEQWTTIEKILKGERGAFKIAPLVIARTVGGDTV